MNDNVFYDDQKKPQISTKFNQFKQSNTEWQSKLYSTYDKVDLDKFDKKISNLGRSKQYLLFLKQLDRRHYNLNGLTPSYIQTTKSQLPQQYKKLKVDQSSFKSAFLASNYGQQERPKGQSVSINKKIPERQRVVTEYVPFNDSTHFSQALLQQRELDLTSIMSKKSKAKDKYIEYYEQNYLPKKNKIQNMTLEQHKSQGVSKLFNKNEKKQLNLNINSEEQIDDQDQLPEFNYLDTQNEQTFELPNIKVDSNPQYLDQNFDSFKFDVQKQEKEKQKGQQKLQEQLKQKQQSEQKNIIDNDLTQRSFKIGNESENDSKNSQQKEKTHKDYIVELFDEIKVIQINDMNKQLQKFQPYYDLIQQSIFNNNLNKKNFYLIVEQDNPSFTMILDEENQQKQFLQFIITPIKEFSKQELQKIQESQTQSALQIFENNLAKFLKEGHQEFYIIQNYVNQNNETQKFICDSNLKRPLQILKRFTKSD